MTWLPSYFNRLEGLPMSKAGPKSAVVMLMAIVGAPLGGYLADRWQKKRKTARLLFPSLSSLTTAGYSSYRIYVTPGKPPVYGSSLWRCFGNSLCSSLGSRHSGCSSPRPESNLLKPLRDCATSLWKRPWSAIHRLTIGQVQP